MQPLSFKVVSQPSAAAPGVLEVTAPKDAASAPPGFYLVFLVAGDLYSDGVWVQVRDPPPKPLAGVVPPAARLVPGLSTDFEGGTPPPPPAARLPAGARGNGTRRFVVAEGGPSATLVEGEPEAAATGAGGLRVTGLAGRVRVLGPPARLEAGKECTLALWARGAAPGAVLDVAVVAADGKGAPALAARPVRPGAAGTHCLFTLPPFKPPATGDYRLEVASELGEAHPGFDIDDVEVYCMP
jgi:hypothetical protein